PRATSACASDPNDPCCAACGASTAAGCPSQSSDSACALGTVLTLSEDSMNLRCFDQNKRFGIDLLYPVERYIEGLTKASITPRAGGPLVPNPLFAAGANGAL